MESATTTLTPNILTDLGFEKLGQGVMIYRPTDNDQLDVLLSDPTLIIICSWAFAQPKHIKKYVIPYQSTYPAATILLVQNVIGNSIWKPDSWQMSFFQPAAMAISRYVKDTSDPKVLLHAFSNGGSHAAVQLSQACRETCGGMRMPVDALLLDSCPGQPRFAPTIAALVQGIPSNNSVIRGIGTLFAYAAVGSTALLDILNISEPAAWKLYRKLNDPTDVFLLRTSGGEKSLGTPIPRTYLYSKSDRMIMWADVHDHAQVAREKLLAAGVGNEEVGKLIQLEDFVHTAHVNHIQSESERYWTAVQSIWDKTRSL